MPTCAFVVLQPGSCISVKRLFWPSESVPGIGKLYHSQVGTAQNHVAFECCQLFCANEGVVLAVKSHDPTRDWTTTAPVVIPQIWTIQDAVDGESIKQ